MENNIKPLSHRWERRITGDSQDFYIKEGVLWHVDKTKGRTRTIQEEMHQICVPISLRQVLLHGMHDISLTHAGFDRCLLALRRKYFWHNMRKNLKIFIRSCQECQQGKSYHRHKALLKPLYIPNCFGNTLHVDHMGPMTPGPNGEKYVFSVVDSYSNWVWLYPVKTTSAEEAVKCLLSVVSQVGAFQNLISDNAQSLVGKVMTLFCKLFDINKIRTSSYSAASNARVERMHSTLGNALRTSITNEKSWVDMLPFIEISLRSSPIRTLGLSPFELVHFGRAMCLPVDLIFLQKFDNENPDIPEYIREVRSNIDKLNEITMENKKLNQILMKEAYDKKASPFTYCVGQLIWLYDKVNKPNECHKLRKKWRGPFRITEITNEEHNVRLDNPSDGKIIERAVHINRIKPCYLRDEVPKEEEDMIEDIPIVEVCYPDRTISSDISGSYDAVSASSQPLNVPEKRNTDIQTGAIPKHSEEIILQRSGNQPEISQTSGTVNPNPENWALEATQGSSRDTDKTSKSTDLTEFKDKSVSEEGEFYDAVKIMKQKTINRKLWYLIRWRDAKSHDSWCQEEDVTLPLINEFYRTHTKAGKVRKSRIHAIFDYALTSLFSIIGGRL